LVAAKTAIETNIAAIAFSLSSGRGANANLRVLTGVAAPPTFFFNDMIVRPAASTDPPLR
jgi:hypothetical protein